MMLFCFLEGTLEDYFSLGIPNVFVRTHYVSLPSVLFQRTIHLFVSSAFVRSARSPEMFLEQCRNLEMHVCRLISWKYRMP